MNKDDDVGTTTPRTDVELMKSFMNRPDTYQCGRVYSHGVVEYV